MSVFDFFKKKKTEGNELEAVVSPQKPNQNFLTQFLPEDPDKRTALARSLLLGGAAMMAAGSPSAQPTNFMQALGQGVGAGVVGYDDAMETSADAAKTRLATDAATAKTQKEAEAKALYEAFYAKYGDPGPNGYPPEALHELSRIQAITGDREGQRQTTGFMQNLNQAAGDKLMMPGADGSFVNAPGTVDAAAELAAREEAAKIGQRNTELTAEQKNRNAGIDPVRDKYLEEGGKKDAAEMSDAYADASKSRYLAADVQRYIELQNQAGSGKWAELKVRFGPYFESLGMDVEGLDENQAMQALESRIAPQLRTPGSGASSDYDAQQFTNSIVNLSRTNEGNKLVADTISAVAAHKQTVAEIWTRTQTPGDEFYGKPYLARKAISELPNPYEAFKAAQEAGIEQGDGGSVANDSQGAAPKGGRVGSPESFVRDGYEYYIENGQRFKRKL